MVGTQSMSGEASPDLLPVPTPAGIPPDRLSIPRLARDVPVVPAGMVPVPGPGDLVTMAMPPGKVAGWLTTSAGFGQPGNTVLTGRHQARGLTMFHGLWTLEAGDEMVLYAGQQARRYVVDEVLILPEQDQPLAVRLANAEYIQPTGDERLTLVTGWPEKGNTHRTIVIALPMMSDE
jgi:LPXTG-site transpeptidase (sortase) family protein